MSLLDLLLDDADTGLNWVGFVIRNILLCCWVDWNCIFRLTWNEMVYLLNYEVWDPIELVEATTNLSVTCSSQKEDALSYFGWENIYDGPYCWRTLHVLLTLFWYMDLARLKLNLVRTFSTITIIENWWLLFFPW